MIGQNGSFDGVYPVLLFGALWVKIREEGLVCNKAVYLVLATTCQGEKKVLGLRISSTDVFDMLTDLFILRGFPTWIRSDNGPEFVAGAARQWIAAVGRERLHRAGLAPGERIHRELQCAAERQAPERAELLCPEGSPGPHRILAARLQYRSPAQQPRIGFTYLWQTGTLVTRAYG